MSFFTDRLDDLVKGRGEPPPVVRTLQLGTLDEWSEGRAFKRWAPSEDVLNADGSMFGGYIAALADQMLAFAAMTIVPEGSAFRTINLNVQFFRMALRIRCSSSRVSHRLRKRSSRSKRISSAKTVRSLHAPPRSRWSCRSVHREFGADALHLGRGNQPAGRDAHRMQLAFDIVFPEAQELVEHRKFRREVELLPEKALYTLGWSGMWYRISAVVSL